MQQIISLWNPLMKGKIFSITTLKAILNIGPHICYTCPQRPAVTDSAGARTRPAINMIGPHPHHTAEICKCPHRAVGPAGKARTAPISSPGRIRHPIRFARIQSWSRAPNCNRYRIWIIKQTLRNSEHHLLNSMSSGEHPRRVCT